MQNNVESWLINLINSWVTSSDFLAHQAFFFNTQNITELVMATGIVTLWFFPNLKTEHHQNYRQLIVLLFLACPPTYTICRILQLLIHRPRPLMILPLEVHPIFAPSWEYFKTNVFSHLGSFPSDHAALLFIFITILFHINQKLGWISLLLSVYYSFLRVGIGWHWPADIVGGALLGFLVAYTLLMNIKNLTGLLDWVIAKFDKYPARAYTIGFLVLNDFSRSFELLKGIYHLVFGYNMFH